MPVFFLAAVSKMFFRVGEVSLQNHHQVGLSVAGEVASCF